MNSITITCGKGGNMMNKDTLLQPGDVNVQENIPLW